MNNNDNKNEVYDKKRKMFGLALVVICSFFLVFNLIVDKFIDKKNEKASESSMQNEESYSDVNSSDVADIINNIDAESEKQEEGPGLFPAEPPEDEEDDASFEELNSILRYILHDEIKQILEPKRFDQELLNFLTEQKKIETASFDANATGIFTVQSIHYLKIELNNEVYMFDIKIDNQDRTIITVAVDTNGQYAFSLI